MRKILLFAVTCTVLFVSNSFAQFPGCPAINATNAGVLCGQNCTNLTATAFGGAQTTAYTVSSIAYTPPFAFNTGTQILVNIDDRWSSAIALPFRFCFFGNDYNSIIVGSNGVCSFNTTNAGAFNNWNIPAGGIPNATEWPDLHNSIMGPWHDIDPTNQGQIFYEIGGTAPCRYFKVSWFNVPHYGAANSVSTGSCPGQNLRATQQIILYETTNVIDMYIQQKQFCAAWDGGVAVQGIQNANGTVAYTVPGRNGTQWNATNDAQRFTPSGAVNYTIAWFLGATQIGTGNTITVCPPSTTVYTAKATYTDCSSATPDIEVTSDITVTFAGITTTIDSVRTISCNGGSDGAAYASFSVGSTVLSYGWSPGGTPNQTSITGIPAGTYIFSVTDGANCTRYDTVVLVDPPLLTVDVPDATIISCGGGNPTGSLTATPTGGTPGYTYSWTGGYTTQTISGVSPGVYIATVTDSKGCTASDGGTITVNTTTVAFNQPVNTDASCGASNGTITVSVSGATPAVTYTWSNGLPNGDTQTGLAGGTYSVTATDANGCSATASYTVGQTSAISFNTPLIEDASCAGNDGNIEVSLTGATPTISYSWSNGLPDSDVQSGLAAGTYCVTATDGNACTASACYTIAQAAPITFGTPVITDATCAGNDGSIVITVNGATNPIVYTWSNSLPDNDTVTALGAGTYLVTATDANGCSVSASHDVDQAPALTFGIPVITDATCVGNDGSIVVTVNAATNPIAYTWSNSLPDNDTVTGLAAGTYNVTATDANGCSATASYTVGQSSSALTFGTPVITDATCIGNDGSIVVTVNGATDPIVYTWSNSLPDNDTVTGLAAGTYFVTATDANGCSATASYTVGQSSSALTFGAPVITDATCGGSNGSIVVTVNGATDPIVYTWSNSLPDNDTVAGLAAGTYFVTATDANGCSATASYSVGQGSSFTFGTPVITDATCASNDGSIVVTTNGATLPINFTWSNGLPNNDTVTGIATGVYSVTATDANGCSATASYNVGQGTSIVITNAVVTDVSCSGTGSIAVTATGGTGTLTYTWSGNLLANPLTGLSAGTYTLTITDQAGCSVTATYIVGNTPCGDCPAVSTNNNVTIPCGETCANLTATAVAGAQTTSYTGAAIAYSPAAAYNSGTPILVGDDDIWSGAIALPFNFCFFGNTYGQLYVGSNGVVGFNTPPLFNNNSWEITGPIPSATPNDLRNCIMGPWHDMDPSNQGTIYYSIIGTYPCRKFVVSWYQVPMFGDPNSSNPGTCNAQFETQQIVLYETTNVIDIYIQDKTVCAGWNDGLAIEGIQNAAGTVAYSVPGRNGTVWIATNDAYRFTPAGAPNYVINWYQGATQIGTGDSITVCPDSTTTYTVEAVYTNCDNSTVTVSDSVFVTVQGGLTATVDSVIDVSCFGANDGAVYASFESTNGTVTSFGWTPGGANQTSLTNIPAGTYVFTVTNSSGCTVTDTAIVTEPAQLVVNVTDTTLYNCVPAPVSTSLAASASGGTAGYTYDWGGGNTNPTLTGLDVGTYTVTVTDANGCSATGDGTVTLTITDPIFNQPVITNVTCNGGNDGSIVVSVSQATPVIDYTWSNSLPNNDTVSNLTPGTYLVTATDANGCSVTASYDVTEPTPIVIGNATITDATCTVGGTITVTATGGTGTLTYGWSNNQSGTFIDSLAAGPYTLTVTDAGGCTATASFVVDAAPNTVAFGQPTIVDVTCNGGNNGSITATATGGTGTITFVWNTTPQQNGAAISGLIAGSYTVTITDALGCSASTTYIVNEPTAITVGNPTITPATCTAGGTVTVTATGGTGTLTYGWSNGDTGTFADSLQGGTVTVTVTDANACTVSASFNVPSPNAISLSTSTVTNITCNGADDGSINVVVVGGTSPIVYTWSPNVSSDSIATGLDQGSYAVTVTDNGGCSATATYSITEPTAVTLGTPTIVDATCSQGGSITAAGSGGTGTLDYAWTGPSSSSLSGNPITNLAAGTYTLTVTDDNGCSAIASYTVGGASGTVTLGTPIINNVSCNGLNDGSITATATGTGTITYTWSTVPQQVGATITGLAPGSYTVTATSSGGNCTATATYTITEPTALSVTVTATSLLCFGDTTGSATANATGGTGNYTYQWNPAQSPSTNTATGLEVGIVLVTVTDANGCTATDNFIIGQSPSLSYNSQVNQPTCADLGFGTEILTPRGGTGAITVSIAGLGINTTLTMVGEDTVLTVPNVPTGTYTFTLTDALGCSTTGNFFVNAGAANESFDLVTDSTSCFGDRFNDGSIVVTPNPDANNAPYTYSFNGGGFQTDSAWNNLTAGTYTIVTKNSYGCLDTLTAVVEQPARLFVDATPDTIVTGAGVGNDITTIIQGFVSNPVYTWSPAINDLSCTDCANPTATVNSTTVFYVQVSEEANKACAASDSVVIIVNGRLKMPNAFSPNNDGKNDSYGPVNRENTALTVTAFRIYNRWGELVHNDTENWNGKLDGKDQPAGTYIYYISVKTPDENNPGTDKVITDQGAFTLLR